MLTFYEKTEDFQLKPNPIVGNWLRQTLTQLHHDYETKLLLKDLEESFPAEAGMPFSLFLISPEWLLLREKGLLVF